MSINSPYGRAPAPRQQTEEPIDNAARYFARARQHGDNIGNPDTRRKPASRHKMVNLILTERAKRNPQCMTPKPTRSIQAPLDLPSLIDYLDSTQCNLEYFGDYTSADVLDYHIIYDYACSADEQVTGGGHVKLNLIQPPAADEKEARKRRPAKVCDEAFASTQELHDKLFVMLKDPQKGLISIPGLYLRQETIQYLRQLGKQDKSLKFVLATWSQEETLQKLAREALLQEQADAQRSLKEAASEPQFMTTVNLYVTRFLTGLGGLGMAGLLVYRLIECCRGEVGHEHLQ